MQSFSSAVDGKTLIRVGGGHGSKTHTLPSNGVSHTAKSDIGISMTSPRRPSLTSSPTVNITSSTISIGDVSAASVRSASGGVTVKTITPQKKMTSIIDTKSGVVTTSLVNVDPVKSSSASATSPSIVSSPIINNEPLKSRDDVSMTLPNRTAFAKSTSVLLMSSTVKDTSQDGEGSPVLMTSTIPRLSPDDARSSHSTIMTSPIRKTSSIQMLSPGDVRLTSSDVRSSHSTAMTSPTTSSVAMSTPTGLRNAGFVVAEVHSPPTGFDAEDNDDHTSNVSLPHSAGPFGSKVMTPSESYADETGSLVFSDEIDLQDVDAGNRNIADTVQLPVLVATQESSLSASNKKPIDLDSKPPSRSPLSSPPSSPNPHVDPPPSASYSVAGPSFTDATKPEVEPNDFTGSESAPETNTTSTFNFIGWNVGNMADKMADRKCHRVLIFKDSEIVLMFKASCLSEGAANDQRLRILMTDIAINCAKRLKRMKDVTLPKLEAEHMDSLPLTDERSTRQHLDEISRELNENVVINDVAFRFQSPEDDTYIGTYVGGNDVPSTDSSCRIGLTGVVVVLKRKSRFSTVESFSDQLCRHILSARPSSLGQISDLEVRRISSTSKTQTKQLDPDKKKLLLFQDFLGDQSIIVAEAARRSSLRIQDFLLFA